MRLFSRGPKKPPSRFPNDILVLLDRFGRDEANPSGGLNPFERMELIERVVAPFVQQANADPHGFFADLQSVVADDANGFATFGAARLVWELLYGDVRDNPPPSALALVKAGIEFKRAHGLWLTMWEMRLDRLP